MFYIDSIYFHLTKHTHTCNTYYYRHYRQTSVSFVLVKCIILYFSVCDYQYVLNVKNTPVTYTVRNGCVAS